MEKTATIRRFIANCGSSIVSVTFFKKDGSIRNIQFNPADSSEVKGTGNPLNNPDIIKCRDFRKAKEKTGAWRSFDCGRVISIKGRGQTLDFPLHPEISEIAAQSEEVN
jgi:hypothetical protein